MIDVTVKCRGLWELSHAVVLTNLAVCIHLSLAACRAGVAVREEVHEVMAGTMNPVAGGGGGKLLTLEQLAALAKASDAAAAAAGGGGGSKAAKEKVCACSSGSCSGGQ